MHPSKRDGRYILAAWLAFALVIGGTIGPGYAEGGMAGGAGDRGPGNHPDGHHPDGGRHHVGDRHEGRQHPWVHKPWSNDTSGSGQQYNIIIRVTNAATGAPEEGALCLMQFQPSLGLGFAYTDHEGVALSYDAGDTSVTVSCQGTDGTSGTATAPLHANQTTVIRIGSS
ncbi:MAG: hypothetical protein KGI33_07305 [Thaumarchaeota archaeon]|nr:hypothetical protein [Nitrososphaerota archaeon]